MDQPEGYPTGRRCITIRVMAEYVQLRPPGEKVLPAKVEAERDGLLVLAAPYVHLGLFEPPAGTVLDIAFERSGTRLWSSGVVTDESGDGRLVIRILGDAVEWNRRKHVRLPAEIELTVFAAQSTEPLHGVCVDVSETGLQAVLPLELAVGDSARIGLVLEDGSQVETTAKVLRRNGAHRFGLVYELLLRGPRAQAFALALRRAASASTTAAS